MKQKHIDSTARISRRDVFKVGAQTTLLGALAPSGRLARANAEQRATSIRPQTPTVMCSYTAEDHRRRLQNIAIAEHGVRACLRKHFITDYLPGQCCYNLGMYPCRQPWTIDEFDERELDKLRDDGIRIIQLHEEWNDALRLFGSNKLAPLNPAGFRRFVDMAHRRGIKLIVYVSSNYFQRTDPDFREEWATGPDWVALGLQYAQCCPESTGWRSYLLPQIVRILDEYGVDGIYNDDGYVPRAMAKDGVLAFQDKAHGALGDLLALIYAEVHRRGGIVKVHSGGFTRPLTDLKVYDYLWVGEGLGQIDQLREAVKNHPPYVVPCIDLNEAKIDNEDELYLHAIPYLQFPLLQAGRPFTGEMAEVPGVKYATPNGYHEKQLRKIWQHYQAHPEGPHTNGWWDSSPGRPEARATHARWLKQYLPMVEEGTWAWLESTDSDLFTQPLPKSVVASVFANREFHLTLANYGRSAARVVMRDSFAPVADAGAGARRESLIGARSLRIFKRIDV